MNTVSKISSKGQLTIPYHIRSKFSFNTGDTIVFEEKEDYVIIRKPKNLMDYSGCLDGANLPDDLEELLNPDVGKKILERTWKEFFEKHEACPEFDVDRSEMPRRRKRTGFNTLRRLYGQNAHSNQERK